MRYFLKRLRHVRLLFFTLLGVLLTYPLAEVQATQNSGEPLVRAFVELFQSTSRETRLEAYFLSAGLPDRIEHTRVLRQQLATADPLERVVILYALAVMTRGPSDVDVFLEEFPVESNAFCQLVNAEWKLSLTLNKGIANFLLILTHEPRTREKAIPHLARIAYNIPSELMNTFLEDKLVSTYIEANESNPDLALTTPTSGDTVQGNPTCMETIERLIRSKDQLTRITALLITERLHGLGAWEALVKADRIKSKHPAQTRLLELIITAGALVNKFPVTRREVEELLCTEKQLYRPPLRGVISILSDITEPTPSKDEFVKLRAALRYGKPYLERYELNRLEQMVATQTTPEHAGP